MFDLGWSELTVLALVILIVIGPKELPQTMRTIGNWVGKARRMAGEFQRQVNDMIDESDLADVRDDIQNIGRVNVEDMVDPTGDIRKGLEMPTDETPTPPVEAPSKSKSTNSGDVKA